MCEWVCGRVGVTLSMWGYVGVCGLRGHIGMWVCGCVSGHAVLVAARFSKRAFVFLYCSNHWSVQCLRVC